jgi:putative pyruvate formate lyase activating enzyme
MFEPRYIGLYRSGELERRAAAMEARLSACDICPRRCRVNRLKNQRGFCRSGFLPVIASVCDHHGEEPVISGDRGSGAIFFGNCNLKCVYCQNYQISQNSGNRRPSEVDCKGLAEQMLYLQDERGCHNINLVSASHFLPQLFKTLIAAIPMGLRIPLVYNSNAYETLSSLKELDGVIDIYLPDLKYASDSYAKKFSRAPDYVRYSRKAIREMYRQVGELTVDDDGVAQRGLIVRHLILPNDTAGSKECLTWLAEEVSTHVTVSIMAQYYPCYRAPKVPLLSRKISAAEYEGVVEFMETLGFERGWIQELDASEDYLPNFDKKENPFA